MRIAITSDELIYSVGKYGAMCRCKCYDQSPTTTVLPLDRVTDVKVIEAAGGLLPRNVLDEVHVQTAGRGTTAAEVVLKGLVDSHYFRSCVRAARRGDPLPQPKNSRAGRLYAPANAAHALHAKLREHTPMADDDDNNDDTYNNSSRTVNNNAGSGDAHAAATAAASQEQVALLKSLNDDVASLKDDLKAIREALVAQKQHEDN
eukprot:TRINITY_DN2219_c0_g1_i1.p1 TRINITY_DN2219_c0_g1~~TRINITY_DN2219_c0_g1_i1.p1  ORF type:complete len:204 (+),score=62.76 TRINITY_DN2219_c0_g1_i1:333-944(+)